MAASERYGQCYAYESITVSTTAIGLTQTLVFPTHGSNPAVKERPAFEAYITVEATNGLRYRIDGTDPTSSEGHAVAGSGTFVITGTLNCSRLRMIRSGGSDAIVKVSFLR